MPGVSGSTTMALPRAAQLYLWGIAVAAGATLVAWVWAWNTRFAVALSDGAALTESAGGLQGIAPVGPPALGEIDPSLALALLGLLLGAAVLAQYHSLQLGPRRKVSVAIGVYFAGLLLFGPAVGVALTGAGQLLGQGTRLLRRDPRTGRRLTSLRAAVFNTGQMMLATAAGGAVHAAAVPLWAPEPLERAENLWALPLAAGAMYLVNSLAVAVMVALQLGQAPAEAWRSGRRFDLLHFFVPFLAGLAVALAAARHLWGPTLLVAGLAATHLALRQSLRLEAGARAARLEAERAGAAAARAPSEFFRVAAHELRTPLTSLRGYIQLLMAYLERGTTRDLDLERTRRALRVIDEESERLTRLATQLYDASRLHQGGLTLVRSPADLAALAGEVAEAAGRTARHPLVLEAPETVWAEVDAPRLQLAVRSLLELLLRYVTPGEPVEVAVYRTAAGEAAVSVGQRRAVLPPEYRHHLLDRFTRASREHRLAGLGLGLYVSRHVVAAHGGAIRVECPPEGGTRLVLTVPGGAPPADPPSQLPPAPPTDPPAPADPPGPP